MTADNHTPGGNAARAAFLRATPRLAAITVTAIGVLEFAWVAGEGSFWRRMLPGDATMRAHAGLCFVLLGLALYAVASESYTQSRRWIAYGCASVVMLLGSVTIAEYLSGSDWKIDQLVLADRTKAEAVSAMVRMAPATALCSVLAAGALLLLTRRSPTRLVAVITASLGALVAGFGILSIGGYIGDAVIGHRAWNPTGMALHSALTFLVLGLAEVALTIRRHGWNWALGRATTTCFVTGMILLIGVCAVAFRALNSFADTASRVAQTHQVQAETGHLQRALIDAAAARRAYVAAPEERHVTQFREAALRAREHLTTLARLTADNPRQRATIVELESLLVGPITRAAQLATPTSGSVPVPSPPPGTGAAARSQSLNEELLNLLAQINAEEQTQLRGREQQASRNFDLAMAVVPGGTVGSVLLLSMALYLLNREAGERKRSQADLLDSERRYRLLFESSPLPMWVFDRETLRFGAVNGAACAFYGYSRDEFLAMTIKDIRPPEEVPALLGVTSIPQPAGIFHSLRTWKHRKKDGTIALMDVSSHDLELDGRPGRLVVANDVTTRVRAEETLAAERALLRTAIDLLPDFIYVKDRDSRFITANAACARYMGARSPHELLGRTDADFYPAETAAGYRADELRALEGIPVVEKEEVGAMAAASRRIVLTTKVPLRDAAGNIVGVVGTGRDITASKTAEAAIRQLNADLELRVRQRTAQLEEAIKELESFSYSVSHDLRAPLRHVQGYVALLERATQGQLSEKAQRHLKVINDASVEMGRLIDDLLDFSRMRRADMSESRVSLDDVLRETMRGLEPAAEGRNIVWKVSPLPRVIGDAPMLRQVLANLVGNALKYTRQRNPAEIEIGCAGEENGRLIVFVRDNGAGFDMQYAHKLFGVFQRLHRSDEFEGTGIGLATVRRVIARHGGRVWAEGAVGRGATFYFTLLRAQDSSAS